MNDPTGVTEVLGSIPKCNSANLKISSVLKFSSLHPLPSNHHLYHSRMGVFNIIPSFT